VPLKSPGILQHHTEHAAQVSALELRDIYTIDEDLTTVEFVDSA